MTTPSLLERALMFYARRFPINRGKLRLVNALWRRAAGSHGNRRIGHLEMGGYSVPCDLGDVMSRQCYFFGTYFVERDLLALWQGLAREATTVFDIGANAGIYSLATLAVQPEARVHAFEPTLEIADRLRDAVARNNLHGLHVHECAVSSRDGEALLTQWRGEDGMNEGMNFLGAGADPSLSQTMVRTVRLDTFCAEAGITHIDLLKIDVQGHEDDVLEGAADLLARRAIGTIQMELNLPGNGADASSSTARSIARLADAGFSFAAPRAPLEWRPAGAWLGSLTDVFAAHHGAES